MSNVSNQILNTTIRAVFLGEVTDAGGRTTQGWAALQPAVPLDFSDEETTPPNTVAPFARVTILGANTDQVEFGQKRRFRRFGIVRVQLWLEAGSGSGLAFVYADSVKTILEGRTLTGGVRLRGTSPPVRERAEGAWSRWRVDTDFDGDELRLV